MRAALPGTQHTTTLARRERVILYAVECCPGVKKLKVGRVLWTGPSPLRLQLRYGRFTGVVKGWLFIGTAKRLVMIYPESHVGLETLGRRLAAALDRYKVQVEPEMETWAQADGMEGQEMPEQIKGDGQTVLIPEKSWPYCEQVYEGVKQVKALEEQEQLLELQLEDVRNQKSEAQAETLKILTQMLTLPHR